MTTAEKEKTSIFMAETAEFHFRQSESTGVVQCNSLTIKPIPQEDGTVKYSAVAGILYSERRNPGSFLSGAATTYLVTSTSYSNDEHFIPRGALIALDLDYDYVEKAGEGGYHTRLSFIEKVPVVLDQTKEYNPTIITRLQGEELKDLLYEEIKENTVIPMFPNLSKPEELSKELITTVSRAEQILENVRKGIVETDEEVIAYDGIGKYREWREYLINELSDRGIITKLIQMIGPKDRVESAFSIRTDEKAIEGVITEGLQNGDIRISNEHNHNNHYVDFDAYMSKYAPIYKEVIENRLVPLHKNGDISPLTKAVSKAMTRAPFMAQLDVIEAMVKSLEYQNKVDINGEPGVGKTLMMIGASLIDAIKRKKPLKSLVLSPGHLVETTWKEEFEVSFSNLIKPHIIRSVADLRKYESKGYFDDRVNRAFILAQNDAKSGYRNMPAALWNRIRERFECPDCNEPVTYTRFERDEFSGERYEVVLERKIDFFNRERENNKQCEHCGSSLWQPINRQALPGGFKAFVSGEEFETERLTYAYTPQGFFPRDEKAMEKFIKYEELRLGTNQYGSRVRLSRTQEKRIENLRKVLEVLQGEVEERNPVSPYKVPVSTYIRKKMKGKFTTLIVDELHEFQNAESARSSSLVDLVATIPHIIRGTGTLMNGYARSRFFNDFIMYPEKLIRAGFKHDSINDYQESFGVVEKSHSYNWKTKRRSGHYTKARPGISTAIYPMFLQDSTVFINMGDLEEELPPLKREEPVSVEVSDEVREGYDNLARAVANYSSRTKNRSLMSRIPALYGYLDMPTIKRTLEDEEGNVLYETEPVHPSVDHKLNKLLDIIEANRIRGRRTIVYTHFTSDGINGYLNSKITEEGYNVITLNREGVPSYNVDGEEVRVKKDDRQTFVEKEVEKGAEVLIVNPSLVQTGMNLIDFQTIVYYQLSYNVYTIRQADRRAWRIGQDKPCSIYFIYYKDTVQEDIAKLMATKIVAAEAIEGDMTADGLSSIADSTTAEEELAKKFYESMGVLE